MIKRQSHTLGPFRAAQLRPGDPYEFNNGHPIECLPSGGRHSKSNMNGGLALESDPNVESSVFDVGFQPDVHNLCAPDIAVGNIPDTPGWVPGAPPLAVEYADVGQNEQDLQAKIRTLLKAGARHIWVVRLTGQRRVEVYEPGGDGCSVHLPGQQLRAPGVLANPVPIEALYDQDAAHEAALRNLLNRRGYQDLDAVRKEGREEGRKEGQEKLVLRLLERRFGQVQERDCQRIHQLGKDGLAALADTLLDFSTTGDLTAWLERQELQP